MRTFYLIKVPIIDGIAEVREVKSNSSEAAQKKAKLWVIEMERPGYNWVLLTEHLYSIK